MPVFTNLMLQITFLMLLIINADRILLVRRRTVGLESRGTKKRQMTQNGKNGAIFGFIYPWLSKTKPKIKNRPNSPDVAFYYLSIRIFGEAYKSKLTFTAHPPFSCTSFRTLHQVSCKYYIFSIVAPSRY